MDNPNTPTKKPLWKKKRMWPVYAFVILLLLPAFFGATSSPETESETPQPVEASMQEDHSTAAFIKAKRFVAEALKAPSTAKFPFDGEQTFNLGDNTYQVSSYVDAENSFGAMMRSEWTVTLKYIGGPESFTESWELIEMVVDGEQLYP